MSERIVIGIGELAVTGSGAATLVTHALGSCVAVCLWDPQAKIGGMLHFLLPTGTLNPERARRQPAAFADTGIPLLFHTAYRYGAEKHRCQVKLLGGASLRGGPSGGLEVGRRNVLAAKRLLSQNGLVVHAEAVGGCESRTVSLTVADGRLRVRSGRDVIEEL